MAERTSLLNRIRTWRTFYALWFTQIGATLVELATAPASWLHQAATAVALLAVMLVLAPMWQSNLPATAPEDRADLNRSARLAAVGALGWVSVAWVAPSVVDLPLLLSAFLLFVFGMGVCFAVLIATHVAWRRWIPRAAGEIAA